MGARPLSYLSGDEPTVLVRQQGRIGRITLNRPRALNALDVPMICAVADALAAWREDAAVQAVVVEGAGGRAFCAGGDVRALRALALEGRRTEVETFFAAEYALNLAIARYPKPYVAVIDGICMGGGIGLSVHGGIRVAGEGAVFAMPETGIGMFPDVGATYALPRLRGAWGMYLALTGERLGGADAAWVGLATHLVPSAGLAGLVDAMAEDGAGVLAGMTVAPVAGEAVTGEAARGVAAFGAGSVAEIVAGLEAQGTAWARAALGTLRRVSPLAVMVSFAAVRRGAGLTLEAALQAELALTRGVVGHAEFMEGVRAAVVDKDRAPRWVHRRIEDVDAGEVAALLGG